ncbi:undecaprenyl-diphosphatase, partial [Patescibacteria group bacterium]|nr:undecaprenyl-diphosphatase [Patescibacteria group bacterium]
IGLVVSFITAVLGIKFFLKFIKKNDFRIFGWYRIIIALFIFTFILFT